MRGSQGVGKAAQGALSAHCSGMLAEVPGAATVVLLLAEWPGVLVTTRAGFPHLQLKEVPGKAEVETPATMLTFLCRVVTGLGTAPSGHPQSWQEAGGTPSQHGLAGTEP